MDVKRPHVLVVFDFDYTLVDGNTDTWITKLSQSAKTVLSKSSREMCWTDAMQDVFKFLHDENFSQKDYESCFESLHFMDGMKETCDFIHKNNIPCIILSDSNTYFIDYLVKRDGLGHVFCQVYSNPAEWQDGCLYVERYHSHKCDLCPANLCKKEVLLSFKSEYKKSHPPFDHIFYIGDGKGDLCPSLTLTSKDYILARDGYKLLGLLRKKQSNDSSFDATVIPWKTGFEVFEVIKKVIDN